MKGLFIAIIVVLTAMSFITMYLNPEKSSEVPILYWVTDNNPARKLQISTFQKWLEKNGYPKAEMRVDASNSDSSKKIIQGVSGVAGDDVDCSTANGELKFFVETGIVQDVTEAAAKYKFGPDQTYPAIKDDIVIEGRQYVFPCNVYAPLYFVNIDTFKKYGIELPPSRWTLEEFEALGKKFVAATTKPEQTRREIFFCDTVSHASVARSLGADIFNETMTKASVDSKPFLNAFKLMRKWTYEDHLMPTASEQASFSVQSGYGGVAAQLFNNGNYGMIFTGRHILIQLRQFTNERNEPVNIAMTAAEPPHGGFPNTQIGARAAFVYKGGKHKQLAELFLAYLASEDYNMNIVEDADSLPPNPKYTKTEAYLRPPKYPNEWQLHNKFANDAVNIAIVASKTPYGSNNIIYKYYNDGYQGFLSGVNDAETTIKDIQGRIDDEIARTVKENPKLQEAYQRDLETQKIIDEKLLKGEKIPLQLLKNPFHRKYYKEIGIAE